MDAEPTVTPPGIPVTCFTGFLGAGKTTTILSLLKQLPAEYKVVLLKNEYGDVEVDSLLAKQSQITGVSEILNGCLCCTMVGLIENALLEIKEKYTPDRIIIESSGSAFPATLALQIRQLEPQGFKLDGVVTVIDCVNFRGYEDTSPSAKLQAKYTDLLLLNKHQLVSERDYDILQDHLGELNDTTPRIRISEDAPPTADIVFGLDTKLWSSSEKKGEGDYWAGVGGKRDEWHGDEVETRTVWKGGVSPGQLGKRKRAGTAHEHGGHGHDHGHGHHDDSACDCVAGDEEENHSSGKSGKAEPLEREVLEAALEKLSFEIYRVKGLVRLSRGDGEGGKGYTTHILNYAFGRFELTPYPALDAEEDLEGVSFRLTIMGERGEVTVRARKFAAAIGGSVE